MNKLHISETAELKIDGFDLQLLAGKICDTCKVKYIYIRADSVFLCVSGRNICKAKQLVSDHGAIVETISERGLMHHVKKYIRRYGFAVGAVIAAALIFLASNIALKIEVNGAPDPETERQIVALLREEGLKPGAYIPSQNFLKLKDVIFSRIDGIAWASVGSSGSVITVNVSTATLKDDPDSARIPCNIVASKDAVVKNAVVRVGKLEILLGDAVAKGQILVSGAIDRLDGNVRFYHANADIIGQYEQSAEFFAPFCEETTEYGEKLYRRGLKFFDLEFPLPGDVIRQGREYAETVSETPVKLLGLILPFSVVTHELQEYTHTETEQTEGDALYQLSKKLKNYEENILKNEEIISRKVSVLRQEDGIKLYVKYILEGEIGEIREIFIK